MFLRKLKVDYLRNGEAAASACPIHWIDNFAMRNFTNDAIFDDTLPIGDGLIEVGLRVPEERLQTAMDDWFRRKGYLKAGDRLLVQEARPE
ncbi:MULTISPECIES: hypothetical protein [Acidobacterium]|uniref:Uncharacterized protein n=1 Tax=Acidobacterium capsulatum (strain ATCC 51196 / DSM 11244 / BCRC 80197 / JCM 7670 / NBRC 15755 / NCIMB 13165 / 161) TaxID=240015 RepID=C1F3T0_ACIC5|nr:MULTISPECIES: hypothetical protein [Acidobacterium]ACO33410.1 hypothetical protein ACP_2869 [Acidobacterium capsulatum ATCC 51196]HCT60543.1 hypothetical protein [Acidobacterium sp.]